MQFDSDPGRYPMVSRNSRSEFAIVLGLFVLGCTLRLWALDRSGVEHFDEGVYASALWFDAQFGEPYPGREAYAPPLLSTAMIVCDLIPGLHHLAPFLPSVLAGSVSIVVIWMMARAWFGQSAGIMAAAIVSLSDFHMMYSRMGLTDVLALLLMLAALDRALRGIERRSLSGMMIAGILCGLAWWSKYTGWLPLAIFISGSWLWWLWKGRSELPAVRLLFLQAAMMTSAVVVFAPWWWQLQATGGYSAIAANHAGYLQGLESWKSNLGIQLTSQFWLDGLPGNLSVGMGMILAGGLRWVRMRRSTWNSDAAVTPASPDVGAASLQHTAGTFPPVRLLLRFLIGGIALSAIAVSIWTPLLLTCIALGGMAGVFLWPVLPRLYQRAKDRDFSPTSREGFPLAETDLQCAPCVNPQLAACIVLAWFVGLLLVTPLYQPYPRLFFPLLAAIWLGAAGGVGWWIESSLSVARRHSPPRVRRSGAGGFVSRAITVMLLMAVTLSLTSGQSVLQSLVWQDRTSLQQAAVQIAVECVRDARGLSTRTVNLLPSGSIIRPDSQAAGDNPEEAPSPEPHEISIEDLRTSEIVIYAYGEPALLYHLNELGIVAAPVAHLDLRSNPATERAQSQYLVIGPYAKRTAGFWDSWLLQQHHFQEIGEYVFRPGEIVLLNLFDARWLQGHPEARRQKLEVYRLR